MQDLRIVLVIVGALAIAALVIHGVWTNQRNKRAQLKNSPPKPVANKRSAESRDVDGFDADGVGQVRVVTRNGTSGRDIEPVISTVPQFSAADSDEDDVDANNQPLPEPEVEQTSTAPAVESGNVKSAHGIFNLLKINKNFFKSSKAWCVFTMRKQKTLLK